jgi:hypothetical protein
MLWSLRTVVSSRPRNCVFCSEPLKDDAHRKNERYFCNELCADSGREPLKLTPTEQVSPAR